MKEWQSDSLGSTEDNSLLIYLEKVLKSISFFSFSSFNLARAVTPCTTTVEIVSLFPFAFFLFSENGWIDGIVEGTALRTALIETGSLCLRV